MLKVQSLKKTEILIYGGIFLLIAAFLSVGMVDARTSSSTRDLVVTNTDTEDNYQAHMVLPALAVSTSTVLVDISDVTNYPHFVNAGSVDILNFRVSATSDIAATTTVKIGVVASTTPAGDISDVYWFDQIVLNTNTAVPNSGSIDYSPSILKTRVSGGSLTNAITNDSTLSGSGFATTTAYTSPVGTYSTNPGVGDVVLSVVPTAAVSLSITSSYRVTQ